jgi:cytochrome P450
VRNPHIGFGSGLHYCLGARLGRIQMTALFRRLLATYPALKLGASVKKHESLGFSGYNALNLGH